MKYPLHLLIYAALLWLELNQLYAWYKLDILAGLCNIIMSYYLYCCYIIKYMSATECTWSPYQECLSYICSIVTLTLPWWGLYSPPAGIGGSQVAGTPTLITDRTGLSQTLKLLRLLTKNRCRIYGRTMETSSFTIGIVRLTVFVYKNL